MRRIVLMVLFLLVLATPAVAQQRTFGVKAGVVVAAIDVDPEDADYNTRVTGTFGGFVVLPQNDTFAIQLEALYMGKGGKGTSDLVEETLTIKLGYIELPVLARITASRSPSRSFFVFGGVAPAFRVDATAELGTTVTGMVYGTSTDVGEDYDIFDLGAVVGAGMDIGPYIEIDGRYTWGLLNVFKNPEPDAEVRNRAFVFTVGWSF